MCGRNCEVLVGQMLKKKTVILIAVMALLGVILIIVSNSISTGNDKPDELDYDEYTDYLEKKLENFILKVEGIRDVNVILTLDTSSEQIYAQNQSNYDFLTISSGKGESPVKVTEIFTTIRGVAVACTNGNNDEVKMRLTRLISAYLGISSNRIEIVNIKQ